LVTKKKLKDKDKGLPGLYDDKGKISDDKLKEAKENIEKGEKYQKLLDDKNNSSIITDGKIDSTKLNWTIKKIKVNRAKNSKSYWWWLKGTNRFITKKLRN